MRIVLHRSLRLSGYLLLISFSQLGLAGQSRPVYHFFEANLLANYVFTSSERVGDIKPLSPGINIAHGSHITPIHALVLSYGKSQISGERSNRGGTLTSKAFFLRRYLPKFSSNQHRVYTAIGSGSYRYKKDGTAGELENAGIIIGAGIEYRLTRQWVIHLEGDYRGFTVKQFDSNDSDKIRPFTAFMGFKYFYRTTHY